MAFKIYEIIKHIWIWCLVTAKLTHHSAVLWLKKLHDNDDDSPVLNGNREKENVSMYKFDKSLPQLKLITVLWYRAFRRFRQTKFPNGGLILSSSQFLILPQLPPKILLNSKVVKIDPKIMICRFWDVSLELTFGSSVLLIIFLKFKATF